ncbi:MAG: hypothetical protein JWO76_784 [Nocardioides sp.]|nr:hypothetical protein [Nocardioides sp.]
MRCVGVLTGVGLTISLTACGSETLTTVSPTDEAASDPATSMTAPPNTDAPTYASCHDLSKVFNSRDENQLSYLPEEHWLIVSPSSTAYKIDLVNDSACIVANPVLATFVARFKASQVAGQRDECRATLEQLAAGTFTVGDKTADPEALRDYAVSLCEPLGIAVPESAANSRSSVGPNGVGAVRLGMSVATLKALGARFSEGGAVGEGRCQVFTLSWAGGTARGQIADQAGVEIIYLDRWAETPEGIGAGDDADDVASVYPEYRADSPRLEVLAGRDAMWAFRFDRSRRPIIVDSVALMRTDQSCTIL